MEEYSLQEQRVLSALLEADVDYVCDVLNISAQDLIERFGDRVLEFMDGEV